MEPTRGLPMSPDLIELDEYPQSRPPPSPVFEREGSMQEVLTDGERSMELATPLLPFADLGEVDIDVDEPARADSELGLAGEGPQALGEGIRMIRPRVSS